LFSSQSRNPEREREREREREMTTIRRFCCNYLLQFAPPNWNRKLVSLRFLFISFNFSANWWGITVSLYVTVQHVLLHDLFSKMAWLFPCRWKPRKPSHALQWALPLLLSHLISFCFTLLIFSHYFSVSWKLYWLVFNASLILVFYSQKLRFCCKELKKLGFKIVVVDGLYVKASMQLYWL
jgi:hypothetical protein